MEREGENGGSFLSSGAAMGSYNEHSIMGMGLEKEKSQKWLSFLEMSAFVDCWDED